MKYGVMGNRLVHSSTLMSVLKPSRRLMDSDFIGPVNIGSEEMVTINELVETAMRVSGKVVKRKHKLDAASRCPWS